MNCSNSINTVVFKNSRQCTRWYRKQTAFQQSDRIRCFSFFASSSSSSSLSITGTSTGVNQKETMFFTNRIQSLTKEQLPVLAEVIYNTTNNINNSNEVSVTIAKIIDFSIESNSINNSNDSIKFHIETAYVDTPNQEQQQETNHQHLFWQSKVVHHDVTIDQIITIWNNDNDSNYTSPIPYVTRNRSIDTYPIQDLQTSAKEMYYYVPFDLREHLLDDLYLRGIEHLTQETNDVKTINSFNRHSINELNSCVIDSKLFYNYWNDTKGFSSVLKAINRSSISKKQIYYDCLALAATIIADDCKTVNGGARFQRYPCTLPYDTYDKSNKCATNNVLRFVNGGYIANDPTERRKVECQILLKKLLKEDRSNSIVDSDMTKSDRRILKSLERYANHKTTTSPMMHTQFQQQISTTNINSNIKRNRLVEPTIDLDVQEVLQQMEIPFSVEGARQALVQIGHWSKDTLTVHVPHQQQRNRQSEWSNTILRAAEWYSNANKQRGQLIHNIISERTNKNDNDETLINCSTANLLSNENRIDMTRYDSVCIDHTKTVFRDDAFSIRRRADNTTKKHKNKIGSDYEILIHITDVSDLYMTTIPTAATTTTTATSIPYSSDTTSLYNENCIDSIRLASNISDKHIDYLTILGMAAKRRGNSQYRSTLHPVHILPHQVLHSLSLSNYSRCVTLWVYIDEKTGRLIEYGFDRTIISLPTLLSFHDASILLNSSSRNVSNTLNKQKADIRLHLHTAERILSKWKSHCLRNSPLAAKREANLSIREIVDHQIQQSNECDGDKLERTRAHRLVDNCLALYSTVSYKLLQKSGIPRHLFRCDSTSRVATAPLRRYRDGVAQTHLLTTIVNNGTT